MKVENEVYYITVFGEMPSSYTLFVGVDEVDYTFIDFNIPNSGHLVKGELQIFYMNLYGDEKSTINVEVKNPIGYFELYVKECNQSEE